MDRRRNGFYNEGKSLKKSLGGLSSPSMKSGIKLKGSFVVTENEHQKTTAMKWVLPYLHQHQRSVFYVSCLSLFSVSPSVFTLTETDIDKMATAPNGIGVSLQ